MPLVKKFWRTRSPKFTFAANHVRGKRPLEVGRFLPANEFSGEPFASSRRSACELGQTRANPGELRRIPANVRRTPANVRRSSADCRCWRTVGEFARSSREFARVRASSRRTTVRRVYCPRKYLICPAPKPSRDGWLHTGHYTGTASNNIPANTKIEFN